MANEVVMYFSDLKPVNFFYMDVVLIHIQMTVF